MISEGLAPLASKALDTCRERRLTLAAAESCTGGLVSAALTSIAGSSDVFERGFVTYSNEAKREMLGVSAQILITYGAVSEECALAMANGALAHSRADIAVSVTGIAGPGGGSLAKPVGLVYLACVSRDGPASQRRLLLADHDRTSIRMSSAATALEMVIESAKQT